MEVPQETMANQPPSQPLHSRRRWLSTVVLSAVAISFGYYLRPRSQEGQWLAGRWTNVEIYSNNSRAEREWHFEANGRVSCTNLLIMTGKTPSTQKFAGEWTVRDGSLFIRMDRSPLRSMVLTSSQAYAVVYNAVTGQNLKVLDHESSEGGLVQQSHDRFTVTWVDPSTPGKVFPDQTWTRVP